MNLEKLIILNGCEKPCAYLVCRIMPNGKIQYVNKKLRRQYGNMRKGSESSTLKEFGFICNYNDDKKSYEFLKFNPSIAKYNDGVIRNWQGKNTFTYNEIINMKYYD